MQDAQAARACLGLLRQLANSDAIKESIVAASGLELINQAVSCHLASAGAWVLHTACHGTISSPLCRGWHRLRITAAMHTTCVLHYWGTHHCKVHWSLQATAYADCS